MPVFVAAEAALRLRSDVAVPETACSLGMDLLNLHRSAELATHILVRYGIDPSELAANGLAVGHLLPEVPTEARAGTEGELCSMPEELDHSGFLPTPVRTATI